MQQGLVKSLQVLSVVACGWLTWMVGPVACQVILLLIISLGFHFESYHDITEVLT